MITEAPFNGPFATPFDAPFNGKTFEQQLIAEGAKLILSAPKASGTAPLTGVQSPWVDLSAGYDVALTNAVVNGDFELQTGWTGDGATVTIADGKASFIGNGSTSSPRAGQLTTMPYALGKKISVTVKSKVTNSACSSISVRAIATGMTNVSVIAQTSPVINTEYTNTIEMVLTSGGSGNVQFQVVHNYADSATANGKVMEVQEVMCIDLTTPFTATREPSIQDIQQAMTKAGVTYWNGTKTLKFTNNAVGSNFSGTQTSGWVTEMIPCDTGTLRTMYDSGGGVWVIDGLVPQLSASEYGKLVPWATAKFGALSTYTFKMERRPMQRLDGTDDFNSITNSASMDLGVVAGKEQVWSVLFRHQLTSGSPFYIISKNNTDGASVQYGMNVDANNMRTALILNGASRTTTPTNSTLTNEFYLVTIHRDKLGTITSYVNKASKPSDVYANALTTQPNVRVGRRETASAHFKGDIALLNLYEADTLDIAKILDLEWKIARDYIYTGV